MLAGGRRKGGGVKAVTQPPHLLSASFVGGDLSCLQELFPQHSEEFLREQLLTSTGGVDEAIATILASDGKIVSPLLEAVWTIPTFSLYFPPSLLPPLSYPLPPPSLTLPPPSLQPLFLTTPSLTPPSPSLLLQTPLLLPGGDHGDPLVPDHEDYVFHQTTLFIMRTAVRTSAVLTTHVIPLYIQ